MEFMHLTELSHKELLSEFSKTVSDCAHWTARCEVEGLPDLNMAPYKDSPASNAWDNLEEARIYLEAIEEEFSRRDLEIASKDERK